MDLSRIPFFSELSPETRSALGRDVCERRVRAGEIIMRKGEEGCALFAILSGGVSVLGCHGARHTRILLGPGEIFGEMSIATGQPTSGTIIAAKDSSLAVLTKEQFLALLNSDAALRRRLADMLVERLGPNGVVAANPPECIYVGLSDDVPATRAFMEVLERGTRHYAPGSRVCEAFDEAGSARDEVERWRASGSPNRYLLVLTRSSELPELQRVAGPADAVLDVELGPRRSVERQQSASGYGMADRESVLIEGPERSPLGSEERWCQRPSPGEIERAASDSTWQRERYPVLDHIARWITRREIGVALGSGAARGGAHIGVLQVLEEAGIPIDCLSGSSMGGIVALKYALTGSANRALALVEEYMSDNQRMRQVSWFPRASFLRNRKLRRAVEQIAKGMSFADLHRPVFVATTDLVAGERQVLERGSVATALLATSAIPGMLPPVERGDQLLVDGALVSRIPVDLLARRRCGLTIAVNVIPSTRSQEADGARRAADLRRSFARVFGFCQVIARSWEVLGSWHGLADAASADFLLEPSTNEHSGYDFANLQQMVHAGRAEAEARLPSLERAVHALLSPGGE